MMKKIALLLGIVAFLLASCYKAPYDEYVPVSSLSFSRDAVELTDGESFQLKAEISPSNATVQQVKWESSNHKVATVTESGLVTAVGVGKCTITISAGGKSATCQVTVRKAPVAVGRVVLEKTTLDLEKGQSATLVARVEPEDASEAIIRWSTSDATVAAVDEHGVVTALGGGSATIIAEAGGHEAECIVTVTVPVQSISIVPSSLALLPGQTATLEVTVLPDDATDKTVEWGSEGIQVASVDQEGKVTANGEGTTKIIATVGDKTASCSVTVGKKTVAVESVSLDRNTLSIEVGESETLTATVLPVDATNKEVYWASTNGAIADVDDYGTVTAKSAGSVTITATTADGGFVAACEVTAYVPFVPVTGISLDRDALALLQGQSVKLIATVEPADATSRTVTWTTSAEGVAGVSQNGIVTAFGEGSATITAKAGDFQATCEVTVTVPEVPVIPVESITLNPKTLSLEPGQTALLQATVLPSDATDKTVIWESDNERVARVSQSGRVEALEEGTATIMATSGDKTASCTVTVAWNVIEVTSVTLDKNSLTLVEGETGYLSATVLPENATDRSVTWSSSAPQVASVDGGKVTAKSEGTAIITATSGSKSATCRVTVSKKIIHVTSIELDKNTLSLAVGAGATLTATVLPENATDKSVQWSSTNSSIVSVDNQGRLTAKSSGSVTITATTQDGGLVAACEVTAYVPQVPVESVTLDNSTLSLTEGETQTLTATVSPVNASDKTVTWSSSNTSVATVSNGIVTAVSEGSATITASAGGKSATCTVTVSAPEVPPTPPDPDEHPYTSNVTWTLGDKAYDHTTGGEYPGQSAVINDTTVEQVVKLGTSGGNGDFTINIPAGTTYIGFFALGWKNSSPKLIVTCAGSSKTYNIKANTGVSNTPPYTITTTDDDAYYTYTVPSTTATTIKMQSEGRVIIWGINYYTGEAPGGDDPGGGDTPGGGDPPGGDDDPVYTGWMELPAVDNPNLRFIIHESSANPSGRNYSLYWDVNNLVAHWVAYPINEDIIGSGSRTDEWGYDPKLDKTEQPLLKKAFSGSWDRGHQIPSADRLRRADNVQTFFYTNMTPQNSSFNGGIWNNLEGKVRAWSKQLDTLYVVSGCVVEGSTTYAYDNNGKKVTVPVAYYKALLGYDKSKTVGITSQTSGYTGIAFYFVHQGGYTASAYMNYSMTIDELEAKVGVDFFVNLPGAVGDAKANKVESTKDTWWK